MNELYDRNCGLIDGVNAVLDSNVCLLWLLLESENGGHGPVSSSGGSHQ